MELTIALVLTILNSAITVSSFVLNRKDKAISEVKETKDESYLQGTSCTLLDYRLTQVEKKIDKMLDILDSYEKEIDNRVEKALEQHIKIWHGGSK